MGTSWPYKHFSAYAMDVDNFTGLIETGGVYKFSVGVLCMVIKSIGEKKVI